MPDLLRRAFPTSAPGRATSPRRLPPRAGCCSTQFSSPAGCSCLWRRPRPRRRVKQVRTAIACTQVAYLERPSNLARLKNSRTKTSCAASLASCSLPIRRKQIRHTRGRKRSTKATKAGPSDPRGQPVRPVVRRFVARGLPKLLSLAEGMLEPPLPCGLTSNWLPADRGPVTLKFCGAAGRPRCQTVWRK